MEVERNCLFSSEQANIWNTYCDPRMHWHRNEAVTCRKPVTSLSRSWYSPRSTNWNLFRSRISVTCTLVCDKKCFWFRCWWHGPKISKISRRSSFSSTQVLIVQYYWITQPVRIHQVLWSTFKTPPEDPKVSQMSYEMSVKGKKRISFYGHLIRVLIVRKEQDA